MRAQAQPGAPSCNIEKSRTTTDGFGAQQFEGLDLTGVAQVRAAAGVRSTPAICTRRMSPAWPSGNPLERTGSCP